MRRLFCILLMFCLPLQGFAMQWSSAIQVEDVSFAHEILHEEHVSHHHEDDGSIHFDASEESVQHVQDHFCSPQPGGFFVPELVTAPARLVETLSVAEVTFIPDPMLEQPLRPPASTLG
jgi:hypothetical protein